MNHFLSFLSFILIFGCSTQEVRVFSPSKQAILKDYHAYSKHVMVSSQGKGTTEAALSVLKKKGNIIDAFVAASFAISVERPHSTGLGGGGFLIFYSKKNQKVYAFDFREVAPLKATQEMYLDEKKNAQPERSRNGVLSVATPGLVKGLFEIHRRFGNLPWSETLRPAIILASQGIPLYPELLKALKAKKDLLLKDSEMRETFFTHDQKIPPLGFLITQPRLAKSLKMISEKGEKGFYEGEVARSIVERVQKDGGLLTLEDFSSYKVKERQPVVGEYKGLKIFSMPPPSSGGIHVIQILKMLSYHDLFEKKPQTVESVDLMAKAMQRAFLDRALYLGDPDFHHVPTSELVSDQYTKRLSESLDTDLTSPDLPPLPLESSDTTHFTIADQEGNLVASTQTINGWFGSGVMASGIVLNNEMDDFAQKKGAQNLFGAVGGEKNLIAPNKRPLSSMSPTIVLNEDAPYMALGSPSGTKIISCVAQTLLNVLEFEMPLYEAVAATRVHHQWRPHVLKIGAPYLHPAVEKKLEEKGHHIVHENLGCSIQAIRKEGDGWRGVSDPRGEGLSLGF